MSQIIRKSAQARAAHAAMLAEYDRALAVIEQLADALNDAACYAEMYTADGCRTVTSADVRLSEGDICPQRVSDKARATLALIQSL